VATKTQKHDHKHTTHPPKDRERGDIPSALPRTADEQFSDRIRNMEQRMTGRGGLGGDKKPKDLMRAIGKIDSSDWNVREIEKKIELSKKTEIHGPKGREKVPKWSKEQFQARQHKMSKPQRQDSREAEKFKDIDQTIRNLDKQLKEGHNLDVGERGRNKVASIAGQFGKKDEANSDEKNAGSSNATTNTTNNTVIPKSVSNFVFTHHHLLVSIVLFVFHCYRFPLCYIIFAFCLVCFLWLLFTAVDDVVSVL